jgi:WbqC-like protein family
LSSKRVAILQSNYIPWKGYFDLINLVDEFILYDDRQYTKRDWRNRNRVKTSSGTVWLTVPVKVKGRYTQRIDEVEVSDPEWPSRHWRTIAQAYRAAPHFGDHRQEFERLYLECAPARTRLSDINRLFLDAICRLLKIETKIARSTDYGASAEDRTENLVALCVAAGATTYLSGPSARDYIEASRFGDAGIGLEYMDYAGYPEYPQLHPPFEHAVSILDLIFNTGPEARSYMKSFG